MLPVKWRPQALTALAEIINYIEQYNVVAASKLHHTIVAATEDLSLMPYRFRQGRLPATREMVVHPNYVVIYQIKECVEVIDVLHTSQQYPKA